MEREVIKESSSCGWERQPGAGSDKESSSSGWERQPGGSDVTYRRISRKGLDLRDSVRG